MPLQRVALLDLLRLLERLVEVAAHEAGSEGVKLHQTVARVDVVGIEGHRFFEFAFRFSGQHGGGEHPAPLRLRPVHTSQPEMRLGAVGRLGHRFFEEGDGGVDVAAGLRGAPLVDERCLSGQRNSHEGHQGGDEGAHMFHVRDLQRKGLLLP